MAVTAIAKALEQWGKVAEKLIGPRTTRAQTKADAERVVTLSRADVEADDIRRRAKERAELEEIFHQQNLEAALTGTKDVLIDCAERTLLPENASQDAADPDWLFRWAGFAKQASDADIRALWSKVLAGEIVQPGRFSLRLLHLLSVMRKKDANDFAKFADYVWRDTQGNFYQVWNEDSDNFLEESRGMDSHFYTHLDDLGLIDAIGMTGMPVEDETLTLEYGGERYILLHHKSENQLWVLTRHLTEIGEELYGLCQPTPNREYVEILFRRIREAAGNCNWSVEKANS